PIGMNNVGLIVTAPLGASNGGCAVVTVLDRTPPTIICPSNIVVNNSTGQCSAVVGFVVSAFDCAIADLFCDNPSGSSFPAGITTLTCTAVDIAGNTNTCYFTVTVADNE